MKLLRTLYFIFANTIILFLLAIIGVHFAITSYYYVKSTPKYRNLSEVVKQNYSNMTPADVDDLLYTTHTMHYQYTPWVGMRVRPMKSRFVNVDIYGIRSNGEARSGDAEIQDAVWFFGGSTTFGFGVADRDTIPAQLEKTMGKRVLNFGVPGFSSAQENLLLIQLLRSGYRPSMVVFLDGINESCEIDDYMEEMKALFEKAQDGYGWDPLEIAKPVIYASARLSKKIKKLIGMESQRPSGDSLMCKSFGKSQPLRTVHAQILAERASFCRLYALECRTFVQPFVGVHGRYDDLDLPEEERNAMRTIFEHLQDNWRKAGAEFVTDSLDQYEHHAYIDPGHYSAAASRLIAQAIADRLGNRRN
jgi:hypothetical protein